MNHIANNILLLIHWNTASFDLTISSTSCLFNEKMESENGHGSRNVTNFEFFESFQKSNFMWKIVRAVDSESNTLEIQLRT